VGGAVIGLGAVGIAPTKRAALGEFPEEPSDGWASKGAIPITLARFTHSQTAVLPTPVASRAWRTLNPNSCVSRSTSRIFLIDILILAIGGPCCSQQGLPIC
jgi:hypothetical protein